MDDLAAAVEQAIRSAADVAIVPRFRALDRSAVSEKSPGDWVTDADHESEELITRALNAIDPGVMVVGEEAAAANPQLLTDAENHDRVWVLDPLDGTKSFIDGSPDFATMAALVEHGRTTAAWIWHPIRGRMFTALRGGGAYMDGAPLRVDASSVDGDRSRWSGVLRTKLMPAELRQSAMTGFARAGLEHSSVTASGVVYPLTATMRLTHALYWRTLPWDHAPGTLLAEESGLRVARLDGTEYRPWERRFGVLTASNQQIWDTIRGALPADLDDTWGA